MGNDKINELLEEILKWQVLQGKKILREFIPKLLDNDDKKCVYEMTDGINTSREIEKSVNVTYRTISNWWNEWYSYGILEKKGKKEKKLFL